MNPNGPAMSGPMWMPTTAPDLGRLFAWHPQPVPVLLLGCLVGLLAYAAGVTTLRRRGDRWPPGRTIAFLTGLACIVLVTGIGIGGYAMTLFSVHMAQHMVLSMLAPIPLLMGAPVTLALRALPADRGPRGRPRRLLVRVLHSKTAALLTSPLLTIPLFLVSLYGLYFTPLFGWAMSGFVGHTWMLVHFLVVGLLLFWPILGVDPAPRRHSHGTRLLELLVTAPFHAFFGIAVLSSTSLITQVFAHPPTSWQVSPIADQQTAGAIAWGFSELPTLLVVLVVAYLWARASERQARHDDRHADRTGDYDLKEYNAWLAQRNTSTRKT